MGWSICHRRYWRELRILIWHPFPPLQAFVELIRLAPRWNLTPKQNIASHNHFARAGTSGCAKTLTTIVVSLMCWVLYSSNFSLYLPGCSLARCVRKRTVDASLVSTPWVQRYRSEDGFARPQLPDVRSRSVPSRTSCDNLLTCCRAWFSGK